jgi:hypothetical protein
VILFVCNPTHTVLQLGKRATARKWVNIIGVGCESELHV